MFLLTVFVFVHLLSEVLMDSTIVIGPQPPFNHQLVWKVEFWLADI
jgi:hypothetical protein